MMITANNKNDKICFNKIIAYLILVSLIVIEIVFFLREQNIILNSRAVEISSKRCIQGGLTIFQPARVEQWVNGKWQTIKTCHDNQVCNSTNFECEAYKNPYNNTVTPTPKIVNGIILKQYGEKCTKGPECQSGICSQFGMATRVAVGNWGSPPSISSFPICQLQESAVLAIYKQIYKAEVLAQAVTTAEFVIGPSTWSIIGSTYKIAATSGIEVATYYFLQQPLITKAFDVINIGSTVFSIRDCLKNGDSGVLCQMYLAGASAYPGETSKALGSSLKNLFIKSSPRNVVYLPAKYYNYKDQIVGRKPTPNEIAWIEKMYKVKVIIADKPSWVPHLNTYAAGRSTIGSQTITLYPFLNSDGNMVYDIGEIAIHEIGHAIAANGQTPIISMSDLFANECLNCRWTISQLKVRGYSPQSPQVLHELDYMYQNAWLFKQTALNSAGLVNANGSFVTGQQLANIYDGVLNNPSALEYINIPSQNFSLNLRGIVSALFDK